jgi:hypothetical protein
MRRLLNLLFALVLVLGSGGAELRIEGSAEACGCCESMLPTEPCGCGMPQPSSSQRCGGSQTPNPSPLARPAAAPVEVRPAEQATQTEAHPCPAHLVAASDGGRAPERPAGRAFASGEGPPLPDRQARLSLFRI